MVRVCVFLCCCLSLFAGACSREQMPAGTVATVNGQPISLRLLNAMHDATHARALAELSADALRKQYESALSTLIAHSLVVQELHRRGLAVDPERLRIEEARVREDYPSGEFERTLLDEQTDSQTWRALLYNQLSLERFAERVVAPEAVPSPAEIQAYYETHAEDFTYPSSWHLRILTGDDQKLMEGLRDAVLADPAALLPVGVFEQRAVMSVKAVPDEWRKETEALTSGKMTRVRRVDSRYQMVQLLGAVPANRLSVVDAYPFIERLLAEEKRDARYAKWLEEAVREADIRVSVWLKEKSNP